MLLSFYNPNELHLSVLVQVRPNVGGTTLLTRILPACLPSLFVQCACKLVINRSSFPLPISPSSPSTSRRRAGRGRGSGRCEVADAGHNDDDIVELAPAEGDALARGVGREGRHEDVLGVLVARPQQG